MPETLQSRLAHLRNRLRQMTWLYGLSWLVVVLFGATLLAGVLDWAIRLDDAGVRFLLSLTILAAASWIAWRFLVQPLRRRISDVDIALRIERKHPGFNDSLASTVQFLNADGDPRLGSPALQRQVIERTVAQVERVSLSDVLETRPVRKVAVSAVLVCLLAALVVGLNQAAAATALHRLVFPFANRPWPKTTELRLVDESLTPFEQDPGEPLRLARGDTLEIYVEDLKDELPDDVRMEYKFDEDKVIAETLRRTTLPDAGGLPREVCVASLVALKGPLAFRAVGGDDDTMPWRHLEVVPPPLVESLKLTLTPPAYTGQPVETLPLGVGHLRGLVGTQVELEATVNKPLTSARLRVKDQPPVRVPLSNNGRKLNTSFVISEAGTYSWWFDLKDLQGFENADAPRHEIRGIADLVPDVWIDDPPTDQNVTPTALVPIRVGAKDDLGLRDLRLQFKIADAPDAPLTPIPLFDGAERPKQHAVEYEWDLSELALKPGQRIIFHAEALDDFNLDGEHVGRSLPRTLTVVSPQEKAGELASRQGGLVEELEAAHKLQIQTHEQVEQINIQLRKAGRLRFEEIDLLKRLEIEQGQINSRLSHPVEGIAARTEELLEELQRNRLEDPAMRQRLTNVAEEIKILKEDHLPVIEQELTTVRKLAQTHNGLTPEDQNTEPRPPGKEPKDTPKKPAPAHDEQTALARAEDNQRAVLESLKELLAQLAEWRHHRDVTGQVSDLIANQEALNQDTAGVGRRTFGKPSRDLSPQDQADLARLAERQQKQAQRVGELGETLKDVSDKLKPTSPRASELLADADEHLRQQAVAGQLRESANQLNQNQIGEATRQQQAALNDLNELADILKNRTISDTETLVKKLNEAAEELEQLLKRQEDLQKKMDQAQQLPDPQDRERELERLRQEQQELRRDVSHLARRLRRLEARQSGDSLRRAASRMEDAEEQLRQNQSQSIEREQQEILEDLEQAKRELAQEKNRAEERLARETLERIGDELNNVIAREQTVIDETNRLEALKRERGHWSRAQLKSLRDLAEVQRNLKTETERLIEVIKAAQVFALALQGAARDMEQAAGRLENRQTDGETVARETEAKNRFVDLVAALEPEKNENKKPAAPGGKGGPMGNSGGPQTDGIPHLAQLKMLKTLQEDLIRRTAKLDRLRGEAGELTGERKLELDLLAGEQGQLADLTTNLTAQFAEAFNLEPEAKPGNPQPPEQKPAPEKTPNKRPSLEDELNRDLKLDDLLPELKEPKQPEANAATRTGLVFATFQAAPAIPPLASDLRPPTPVRDDPATAAPTENPLKEAITGMRSAQARLVNTETGEETRKIQEEVANHLQQLIDLAKQPPPPSPPPSGQPPSPDKEPRPEQTPPNPQPQTAGQEPEPQTAETPQQQKQESDTAKESTDEEREGRNAKAKLAPRREMQNEVWGHLPPSVRQKLLSLSSDKYLPKYEDLARRYFEALAEPNRSSPTKRPE